MGALDAMAGRVAAGSTVEFRPTGSSMVPLIRSRQLVTVASADPARVEVGDIVLARVAVDGVPRPRPPARPAESLPMNPGV